MSDPIISVSGLRGIVGKSLSGEVAARYVAAFAGTLPPGPVLVARDGRANGEPLVDAVAGGVLRGGDGREVLYAGVAATPTVGVLIREAGAAGGIQITASHNPAEYNGLKLFSGEGRVLPAAAGERVLRAYRAATAQAHAPAAPPGAPAASLTKLAALPDCTTAHLRLIERIVDVERIAASRFCVLLDANHGAGSVLGRPLLEALGCEVTLLGETPDGLFSHPPEPTAENLAGVLNAVTDSGCEIGFCQDPDADRLAVIDHAGRYLGEEYTLALCVDHVLRAAPGPVVTNCSTSRMTEDLAARHSVPFHRAAVGEANVVDQMLAAGAVLGGEGNGGVIDPRVGLVRDSFVAMALILDAMAARGLQVADLAAELPRYAIHKAKVDLAGDKVAGAVEALTRHFVDARPDRLDGLRLDWPDRWLLVRASNTEPIVRIVAEAPSATAAKRLCDEAAAVLMS